MLILLLNAGSSSLKYCLYEIDNIAAKALSHGLAERIGEHESLWSHDAATDESFKAKATHFKDHHEALTAVIKALNIKAADLSAVGHRVVHGGPHFHKATLINDKVLDTIKSLFPLAPLHNPANAMAIEVARDLYPNVPHYAIFDTAFHHTMPDYAAQYPLDIELAHKHHIRRYGFHGASHCYVSHTAAKELNKPRHQFDAITLHLGNGASACAIHQGRSIDTTMGFTPLAGLMMGTRCGDIDPAIAVYLQRECNMNSDTIDTLFNKQSGLKGIAGDNDMRAVEQRHMDGDPKATLALEMYVYRIKKTIGSYLAILGDIDAVIFTAGVGENAAIVRQMVCHNLHHIGIQLDEYKNNNVDKSQAVIDISHKDSRYKVLVVPTNEELQMALEIQSQL